jgi:hypothetical protein
MLRTNVLLVSGNEQIGAIVRTTAGLVAFDKGGPNKLPDLSTGRLIADLPEDGIYRNVENNTLLEAANAVAENRKPRWTSLKIM